MVSRSIISLDFLGFLGGLDLKYSGMSIIETLSFYQCCPLIKLMENLRMILCENHATNDQIPNKLRRVHLI